MELLAKLNFTLNIWSYSSKSSSSIVNGIYAVVFPAAIVTILSPDTLVVTVPKL